MYDLNLLNKEEKDLLSNWEGVYKKGLLSLWILLSLNNKEMSMSEIKDFINDITDDYLLVDDNSIYRSLRKFYTLEIVDFAMKPNSKGPDIKIYKLSKSGEKILKAFIQRNIISIYYKDKINLLFKGNI